MPGLIQLFARDAPKKAGRTGPLANIPIVSIVDDDESMRAVTCSLIRSLGLTAYAFASAEEFLKSPRLTETACLISDIQMPKMNGIELQRALLSQGHRIPIIFFTAFPDEAVQARAMEAGAIGFLCKPFDGQDMIRCLDIAMKAAGRDSSGN
jgi:FixJ family two-component response regulator